MIWDKFDIRELSEGEYQKWYSLMSEEKQKRVDRFRFTDDKKRTVAGEMLAKTMLAKWCYISPESIVFDRGKHGKPFAVGLDVHFNISHSGNMVVCAVNDKPVGIDIEQIRDYKSDVAKRVCSETELNLILQSDNPADEFTRIWTAKEAYTKYLGIGLGNMDFKSIPSNKAEQYKIEGYWISIVNSCDNSNKNKYAKTGFKI